MRKIRVIGRDIDPETGDVAYFKAGHTSRMEAIKGMRKPKPPSKGQKAPRKRHNKAHYAECPPRPLFHTATPDISAAERYQLKREVLRRDGYRCQQCGAGKNLTLDHIIPRGRGGGWHLENLQCLCETCNQAKSDRMPYESAT